MFERILLHEQSKMQHVLINLDKDSLAKILEHTYICIYCVTNLTNDHLITIMTTFYIKQPLTQSQLFHVMVDWMMQGVKWVKLSSLSMCSVFYLFLYVMHSNKTENNYQRPILSYGQFARFIKCAPPCGCACQLHGSRQNH